MADPYLTLAEFRDETAMPPEDVDQCEARFKGYIERRILRWGAFLDARLRKRYAAPFESPVPLAIVGWVTDLVTVDVYLRRGTNPQDPSIAEFVADRNRALDEIKEAADSEKGAFDLPLRADTTTTGITQGGPFGYSEATPYDWLDVQREGRDG